MRRVIILVILISTILFMVLSKNFLRLNDLKTEDLPNLIYFIVILSSAILFFIREKTSISIIIKNMLLWSVIIFVILLGYSYKNDINGVLERIRANVVPGQIIESGDSITIVANDYGHFYADAYVNGEKIKFLVDTGATTVSLSFRDAEKLGIDKSKLIFNVKVSTANGHTWAAPIKLAYIQIGNIRINDVSATVSQDSNLDTSLLGMSFLRRLSSYQISSNELTMIKGD